MSDNTDVRKKFCGHSLEELTHVQNLELFKKATLIVQNEAMRIILGVPKATYALLMKEHYRKVQYLALDQVGNTFCAGAQRQLHHRIMDLCYTKCGYRSYNISC